MIKFGIGFTMISAMITGCSSFSQTCADALVRENGGRVFGPARPVADEAKKHWQYAWHSVSAYDARKDAKEPDARISARQILQDLHWERWDGFPGDGLEAEINRLNLRVEVWQRADTHEIVVAFGGTVFNNPKDWISNLRWFLPKHDDEYTLVVKGLMPEFVRWYRAKLGDAGATMHLVAAGHSLGGGLAQQFAYALPDEPGIPRVKRVYAFDPSPVTGFYSVDEQTRERNKKELSTDRIFERGEILAVVRSVQSWFFPPSASQPTIREVRYALFYDGPLDPIGGHSIRRLAEGLSQVADARRPSSCTVK